MTEDEYKKIIETIGSLERLPHVWFVNQAREGYSVRRGKVYYDECSYNTGIGICYFDDPRYPGDNGEFTTWVSAEQIFRGRKGALRGMADQYRSDANYWKGKYDTLYARASSQLDKLNKKLKTYQANDNAFWLEVGQV